MNSRGVTLAELLVVLAVLSVGLGVARVTVSGLSMREINAACAELQADLRYAQRQAVIENIGYQVAFETGRNRYTVLRLGGTLGGGTSIVKEKTFGGGVALAGTTATGSRVTYTTRGTTGDPCTITLRNGEYSVKLTVNLGSGRISQKDITKL